jgi:hypothetical protein
MATYVGTLEADLQGSSEYHEGGVGPLFRATRRQGPFALRELLDRTVDALRSADITYAVTLFIDDVEVYTAGDDETDDNLDAALDAAHGVLSGDAGVSFYLMLEHEDDELAHVITVEASADYPEDGAAGEAEADEEDEALSDEDLIDLDADAPDGEALVEAFLRRLLPRLEKELALQDAELETWTDWEGRFAGRTYGGAPSDTPVS